MSAVLGRIPALCLVFVAACYSPPQPDCGFVCGPGGACPANYHCAADNVCHLDGTPANLSCAVDAGVDVLPIDVPIPPDMTPPTVVGTMPADGETNVPLNQAIAVQFSEDVVGVDTTTFVVTSGPAITGVIQAISPQAYVFTPDAPFAAGRTINVTLTTAIADLAANPMAAEFVFSFETAP